MLLRSNPLPEAVTCDDIEVEAEQANCSAARVHVWSHLVTATVLGTLVAPSPATATDPRPAQRGKPAIVIGTPGILRTVTTLEYSDSIDVSVPPDQLYAMVS